MKNIIIFLALAMTIVSCSQEENFSNFENTKTNVVLSTEEAQVAFAQILSKAIYESIDLRSFLKKEALIQFDNDYDVFYPFVKDKIVTGQQTFRDLLLKYSRNEKELCQIEESLELLNIYIPDLSMFWDFNAEKWDINDNEVAVFCNNDRTNTIYLNGESSGTLSANQVPGFPCIVIKNNERLKCVKSRTRVNNATYSFIDKAFDGKNQAHTRNFYDLSLEQTESTDPDVSAEDLNPLIVGAWNEFKNIRDAYQRDYIYYGLTKNNERGVLDRNIRETLYRFKIDPHAFLKMSDQGIDPLLQQGVVRHRNDVATEEIVRMVWTEGNYEIVFKSYLATENGGSAMESRVVFSVPASDLFSIEKVRVDHLNGTAFRHSRNYYDVDPNDLRSKWFYPVQNRGSYITLNPWDLYIKSLSIHMDITETDESETIETTKSVVDEYANKLDFSAELKGSSTTSTIAGTSVNSGQNTFKLGYGFSQTNTSSSTCKVTVQTKSDDLGTLSYFFYDPIIRQEIINNGSLRYKLYNVSNGTVEATILPIYLINSNIQ